MGKLLAKLKRVRFVYRRSNNMTKTVVISAIALSMAALLILYAAIGAAESRYNDQKNQAAQLEQSNNELQEDIQNLGTLESVIELAKKFWNMVFPDTVVFGPKE